MKFKFSQNSILILTLIVISLFFITFYLKLWTPGYLTFSDGAKFADIARNLKEFGVYKSSFSFYSPSLFPIKHDLFPSRGIPPFMPYSILISFNLFGISDFSVMLTSVVYFILLTIFVYLLGERLFGKLIGFLAALAVLSNLDLLSYATSGASETAFTLFAVLGTYLIFVKNKWSKVLFFLSLFFLYLARPQGIVFILVLLFSRAYYNYGIKRAVKTFFIAFFSILLLDISILGPLSYKLPLYPIFTRGLAAFFRFSPGEAVSTSLRGGLGESVMGLSILKKVFYNLYNFYKLMPSILNPYIFGFYIIGLFSIGKSKEDKTFKLTSVLLFAGTFLMSALTIPFYRYLHPIIPFVYIFGIGTLGMMVSKLRLRFPKAGNFLLTSLVLIFVVCQSVGVLFLDSRFERKLKNPEKPPVYVKLSEILKENIDKDFIVTTNLDTWGSWYGERKTMWFPLEPKQIIDPTTGNIPFDAIFLTSYLIDDQNYYMGFGWRSIFENPYNIKKWECQGCDKISENFKVKAVYKIPKADNYENIDASAILFVRK